MLELAGRLVIVKPLGVNKFASPPGQLAAGEPVAEQPVTLQLLRPALGMSLAIALLAEVGPLLVKVMVLLVVLPATSVAVPLFLVTASAVEQAVVRVAPVPRLVPTPEVAK